MCSGPELHALCKKSPGTEALSIMVSFSQPRVTISTHTHTQQGKSSPPRGGLPRPPAHKMAPPGADGGGEGGRLGLAGFLPCPLSEGLSEQKAFCHLPPPSGPTGGTGGCHSSLAAPPRGRRGRGKGGSEGGRGRGALRRASGMAAAPGGEHRAGL